MKVNLTLSFDRTDRELLARTMGRRSGALSSKADLTLAVRLAVDKVLDDEAELRDNDLAADEDEA